MARENDIRLMETADERRRARLAESLSDPTIRATMRADQDRIREMKKSVSKQRA